MGLIRQIMALWTIVVLLASCNRDTILHGVSYSEDREKIEISSVMPRCGCVSLVKNSDEHPSIVLKSSLHGDPLGTVVLQKEERVQFDWADSDNVDRYDIRAYTDSDELLTPIEDYVTFGEVTQLSCRESLCVFGTLALNQAWTTAGVGQGEQVPVRGVNFTRKGQVLAVSSSTGQCGCMLLRNVSQPPVSILLISQHHRRRIGSLVLKPDEDVAIGFDWGGDIAEDQYSIIGREVLDANGNGEADPATRAPMESGADPSMALTQGLMTLQLTDYMAVVGRLDEMECNKMSVAGTVPSTSGGTEELICSYGTLQLRQVTDSGGNSEESGPKRAISNR